MDSEPGVPDELNAGPRRRLWPPLLLGAMALLFFARFLLPDAVFLMRDLFLKHYPLHIYAREILRHGALPLWNPYTGCGEPFLANIEGALWYPPNLLYLVLPVAPAAAILVVLHTWITSAAGYALCRVWRISRMGSLLAGTLLGFNTYWLTRVEFLPAHASITWFPVVLLLYVLWARSRRTRWIVLGGMAFGMQLLAGWPEAALFSMAAIALYAALVAVWDWRQRRSWRTLVSPLLALAGVTALGVLLATAQVLPTLELARESAFHSGVVTPGVEDASVNPLMLATLLMPFLYGVPGYIGRYWAPSCFEYWCGSFYVGLVPVVLIVAALLMRLALFRAPAARPDRPPGWPGSMQPPALQPGWLGARLPFLLLLLTVSILYAMGKYTPLFHGLWSMIPLLQKFRWPSKSMVCAVFALSCLTGLALDSLAQSTETAERSGRRLERSLARWWTFALFAIGAVFVAACLMNEGRVGKLLLNRLLILPSFPQDAERPVLEAFELRVPWQVLGWDGTKFAALAIVAPALVLLWSSRSRLRATAGWLLVLVAYADLFLTGAVLLPSGSAELLARQTPIPETQRGPAPGRVCKFSEQGLRDQGQYVYGERNPAVFRWAREGETMSWSIADHVYVMNPEGNFKLPGIMMLRARLGDSSTTAPARARILQALSVDFLLRIPTVFSFYVEQKLGQLQLEQLPSPAPRAYVVGGPWMVPDARAACDALVSGKFDLQEAAATERSGPGAKELADLAPGRVAHKVSRIEYGADGNSLLIEVWSERAALLVVNDTWYPGWRATIAGGDAPIARVNAAFRGVRVPAGKSIVEMRFKPWTVRAGILVSLGTLAAAVLWLLFTRRSKANLYS